VLTLRADHVDRCSDHPRLRDLLAAGTVLLGPLNAAELTEVVTGPAELSGYDVEAALVDRILNDVRGLTAPLPLVSTALAETWEQAAAGSLTLDGYLDCEPGTLVARRCPYLEAAPDEPARRAIDALAAARLITVDASVVEVAHEALFDNWPRLTNWLEDDEQGRRLRAHLAPAALDWNQNGRRSARFRPLPRRAPRRRNRPSPRPCHGPHPHGTELPRRLRGARRPGVGG
jgi:hypothetical protein